MTSFSFHQRLTPKEYRGLAFTMLYRRWWFLILTIASLSFVGSLPFIYNSQYDNIINSTLFQLGAIVTIFSIYTPIAGYFRANWVFRGNYRLSESITYLLSEEGVTSTGETFSGQYTWDKVYRVRILKKWLLIYQSRTAANLIKIDQKDNENIESLKVFLDTGNFRLKKNW